MPTHDDYPLLFACWRSGQIDEAEMFRRMSEDKGFGRYAMERMSRDVPPVDGPLVIAPQ